jgi:hypothetical protein
VEEALFPTASLLKFVEVSEEGGTDVVALSHLMGVV